MIGIRGSEDLFGHRSEFIVVEGFNRVHRHNRQHGIAINVGVAQGNPLTGADRGCAFDRRYSLSGRRTVAWRPSYE